MIQVVNLSKSFGKQLLFKDISFNVNRNERIGLIGRNGYGKTTLFNIIIGRDHCDSGEVVIPKDYKLGYLEQNIELTADTVIEESCKGLLSDVDQNKWKCEKILTGLGFEEKDFLRSPNEFSSGYQMRIALSKVLVSEPNLLLLDEPTNFLDIVSIRWLETFLRSWPNELIVISHDSNFLDTVTTHLIGIHRQTIKKIKSPTKHYYEYIDKVEDTYESQRINEEKKKKQVTDFITKFRAKARQAGLVQSRIKQLEKMETKEKLQQLPNLSFSFNYADFKAKYPLEAENLSFSYDKQSSSLLINNFSLSVEKTDKICIIGKNGKGKTTLLKLLSENIKSFTGKVRFNPQVKLGYFEQAHTQDLHPENTIEEEIYSCNQSLSKTQIRNICGSMMFSEDNAMKKIGILSGGEKCRVMLAKLLATELNLLLLDEPTHHLDIQSCSAMIEAVSEFEGAAVVATHDENFLRKVATKLIVFGNDSLFIFPGGYEEFLEQVGWENDSQSLKKQKISAKAGKSNRKQIRQAKAEFIQQKSRILRPLKTRIDKIETEIGQKEQELAQNEKIMVKASLEQDGDKITQISKVLHDLREKLEHLYEDLLNNTQEYEKKCEQFNE